MRMSEQTCGGLEDGLGPVKRKVLCWFNADDFPHGSHIWYSVLVHKASRTTRRISPVSLGS